jgi:choline dehydrogenase-like flavoprotein
VDNVSSAHSTQSTAVEECDLVILGGGTGSTIAAWTFASQGQRVAVIERQYIGGSCPNIACLPSKNTIHSAKVASCFRKSEDVLRSREVMPLRLCCRTTPHAAAIQSRYDLAIGTIRQLDRVTHRDFGYAQPCHLQILYLNGFEFGPLDGKLTDCQSPDCERSDSECAYGDCADRNRDGCHPTEAHVF